MEKKYSIVYLRSLATLMIFFCHILFISGHEKSSMWLNVGVQIFFIISAYLMTYKKFFVFDDIKKFWLKRCQRIFLPYWFYIIIISLTLLVINKQPELLDFFVYFLGIKGFVQSANILGLGHLWFVTVILICYLITPILYYISKIKTRAIRCISEFMCMAIVIGMMVVLQSYAYAVYIVSYMFVYLYLKKRENNIQTIDLIMWILGAIFFSVLRLVLDNIGIESSKWYEVYDAVCIPIFKTFLAMGVVVIFLRLENVFMKIKKCRGIEKNSELSYEFYIVHQFIQLALWEFVVWFRTTKGIWIWIIVSFFLSVFNAYILKCLTDKLKQLIVRRKK